MEQKVQFTDFVDEPYCLKLVRAKKWYKNRKSYITSLLQEIEGRDGKRKEGWALSQPADRSATDLFAAVIVQMSTMRIRWEPYRVKSAIDRVSHVGKRRASHSRMLAGKW